MTKRPFDIFDALRMILEPEDVATALHIHNRQIMAGFVDSLEHAQTHGMFPAPDDETHVIFVFSLAQDGTTACTTVTAGTPYMSEMSLEDIDYYRAFTEAVCKYMQEQAEEHLMDDADEVTAEKE